MGFFSQLGGFLNPFDGRILEAPPGLPGGGTINKSLDATVNKLGSKLPGFKDVPEPENGKEDAEVEPRAAGAAAATPDNPNQGLIDQLGGADFAGLARPEQIAIENQARQAAGGDIGKGQGTNALILEALQANQPPAVNTPGGLPLQGQAAPATSQPQPLSAGAPAGFTPPRTPGAAGFGGPQGQTLGQAAGIPPTPSPVIPDKKFQDDLF